MSNEQHHEPLLNLPNREEIRGMVREDLAGLRHSLWTAFGAAIGAGVGCWLWGLASKLFH